LDKSNNIKPTFLHVNLLATFLVPFGGSGSRGLAKSGFNHTILQLTKKVTFEPLISERLLTSMYTRLSWLKSQRQT